MQSGNAGLCRLFGTIRYASSIRLPSMTGIPTPHDVHGALSPRGVRAVFGAAGGIGADAPPVDALEPGPRVERFEDRFVAAGLVEGARGLVPGGAVGMGVAAEAGFGEEDGAGESLLNDFDGVDQIGGGQIVGERVVF